MPYADPQTGHNPTTGQIIPASWGDDVRAVGEYLARNKPHCEAYSTAVQSIANGGAGAALLFPTETFDVGGIHSTSSNTDRFTIPSGEGGKYDIACGGYFVASATGVRALDIQKNGAALTPIRRDQRPGHATAEPYLHLALLAVPLVAGDIIRAVAYQDSGGALNIDDYWLTIKWTAL